MNKECTKESAYLYFYRETSASGKTAVIIVYSAKSGEELGKIAWMGRWRQYAFYPAANTIWNPECMDSVIGQIYSLMDERKGKPWKR